MHRNVKPTSTLLLTISSRIFTVVPSWLMFVLLVILALFPIMYVSLFSYVWIPESPHIWERADDSVCHLPHLFTYVTSWCDFFPLVWYIVGGVSDLGPRL